MILIIKSLAIYGTLIIMAVGEYLQPFKAKPIIKRQYYGRIIQNFALFGINGLLSSLIIIPLTLFATQFNPPPADITNIFLDILIYDFMIYWWHRLNHQLPILWRFHRVHHCDEFYDISTAVRFHAGEVLLSALFRLPVIYVFSLSYQSIIISETILLVWAIFQHANWAIPKRINDAISLVLVTPQWHFLHHHDQKSDTDSHYGNFLTIWDRIFATRAASVRAKPEMIIGLRQIRHCNFVNLLLLPFGKK